MTKDRRDAAELLRPSLEARLAVADGPSKRERGTREFEDGVQWLVDVYRDRGEEVVTPDMIQEKLITIVFASIHSTSAVALTLLFDMMEHPGTLEEIRQEIAKVRNANPTWTRQALGELRLLDSFMRESARVHGASQRMYYDISCSVQRYPHLTDISRNSTLDATRRPNNLGIQRRFLSPSRVIRGIPRLPPRARRRRAPEPRRL